MSLKMTNGDAIPQNGVEQEDLLAKPLGVVEERISDVRDEILAMPPVEVVAPQDAALVETMEEVQQIEDNTGGVPTIEEASVTPEVAELEDAELEESEAAADVAELEEVEAAADVAEAPEVEEITVAPSTEVEGMTEAPTIVTEAAAIVTETVTETIPESAAETTLEPEPQQQLTPDINTPPTQDPAPAVEEPMPQQPSVLTPPAEPQVVSATEEPTEGAMTEAKSDGAGIKRTSEENTPVTAEEEPQIKRQKLEEAEQPELVATEDPRVFNLTEEKSFPKEQVRYCTSMLKSLRKTKDASPFNHPVDAVKLNIPRYPEVIKNPMDLSTMEKKLREGEYRDAQEFKADFDLIVNNCITFNGVENPVSMMARNMNSTFQRQWSKLPTLESISANKSSFSQRSRVTSAALPRSASMTEGTRDRPKREIHAPPRDLPAHSQDKPRLRKKNAAELKFVANINKDFQRKVHEPYAYPFYHPVDPVALNIPDYYKIIKEPMDLSTVDNKVRNQVYCSAEEFLYDMNLIFKNCFRYNPPGSPVANMGKRFQEVFEQKWAEKPPPPKERRSSGLVLDASSAEDDSDASDSSEEDAGMMLLQKQMALMQQQFDEISKLKAKRKAHDRKQSISKSSGLPKSLKKSSKSDLSKKPSSSKLTSSATKPSSIKKNKELKELTREQKSELSDLMQALPNDKLDGVLEIIKETQTVDVCCHYEIYCITNTTGRGWRDRIGHGYSRSPDTIQTSQIRRSQRTLDTTFAIEAWRSRDRTTRSASSCRFLRHQKEAHSRSS